MEAVAIDKGQAQATARMQPNQVVVMGRVEHVGSFESREGRVTETIIAIAAADAYSMPGVVVVQSRARLGNKGDEIKVLAKVTGIPNSWTDKQSGEVKRSANVRLVAVE